MDQLSRYKQLFRVGQIITSEINFEKLFDVIIDQTNRMMDTERTTVFLCDPNADQLWSLAATGISPDAIRMPVGRGIAGWVFRNKVPLVINDAYGDPRFNPSIDEKTGYKTRRILCIPLINRNGDSIGALEALNKTSGDFIDQDRHLLQSVSHYIAVALENSRLYEELKTLNKAKERLIHHLSHELKTPLAVLSGVFKQILRIAPDDAGPELNRVIARGRRNLDRLTEIQSKIDDIIHHDHTVQKSRLVSLIQSAADFVEELDESETSFPSDLITRICERLADVYHQPDDQPSEITLDRFLDRICDRAERLAAARGRDVTIIRTFEKGLCLSMDESVLGKVCAGLLKNGVENTPDGGRIEVSLLSDDNGGIRIDFKDTGVGITPQNQQLIFGGFFHTQETHLYRSGQPYDFNAGGSGADLLRIKVFSERYGFSVSFESQRCPFIPNDADACPGRAHECRFIDSEQECLRTGGTRFSLGFCGARNRVFSLLPWCEGGRCLLCELR